MFDTIHYPQHLDKRHDQRHNMYNEIEPQFISSLSENDKQYETKRAWIFFTIMVSWQQGRIKGGGGVQLLLPPMEFFWGKSEEKVQRR